MKRFDDIANAQKLFEDRQSSFEERMETKMNTFLSNQPRAQLSSRSVQNPWQNLPMQFPSRSSQNENQWQHKELTGNDKSHMQGQSRSIQNRSRHWQPQEFDDTADDAIPDFIPGNV